MITISNVWWLIFSLGIPILLMMYFSYYAGIEEARIKKERLQNAIYNRSK